jgi:hypothetical protein
MMRHLVRKSLMLMTLRKSDFRNGSTKWINYFRNCADENAFSLLVILYNRIAAILFYPRSFPRTTSRIRLSLRHSIAHRGQLAARGYRGGFRQAGAIHAAAQPGQAERLQGRITLHLDE